MRVFVFDLGGISVFIPIYLKESIQAHTKGQAQKDVYTDIWLNMHRQPDRINGGICYNEKMLCMCIEYTKQLI